MTTNVTEPVAPANRAAGLRSTVNQLAGMLAHGGSTLTSGDVASLRRMDPQKPCGAFFKLGVVADSDVPTDETVREHVETRWAAVVLGLAILGDLHQSGAPIGRALADADLSEQRFDRLLRSDAERLVDELPTLARFLAAKGVKVDWSDAARLILSWGRKDEETTRRRVAREYFNALARRNTH